MMSDCPLAGVFTTHGTHKSWIIFRECKTSTGEGLIIFVFLVDITVIQFCQIAKERLVGRPSESNVIYWLLWSMRFVLSIIVVITFKVTNPFSLKNVRYRFRFILFNAV